ncbi:MAG: TIGR02147 family protein [Bdellovibrionaceae bacterium]|nr:TIGR02147 family protein [Pseudobdellovibrionaceae bacterium]
MQKRELFDFKDYKDYVTQRLDEDLAGRGARSRLAKAINCQTAYLSSVLRGHQHFTPEQGEAINDYFLHSDLESEYFLLLLFWQRAGSKPLKQRLEKKITELKQSRFNLSARLNVSNVLSERDHVTYYSEWYYSAIHTYTSLPLPHTISSISKDLQLSPHIVKSALAFLVDVGLVFLNKGVYKIGTTSIHLKADSPLISRHHVNWRLYTTQKLPERREEDIHYSSVVTLSHADVVRIKENIVEFIKNSKAIIKQSPEEVLYSLDLDFFKVTNDE